MWCCVYPSETYYPPIALAVRQANAACVLLAASLALQVVKHTANVTLGSITWKKFPDGFPNIFVHDVESIKGCHVVFLASFSQVLRQQTSLLHSLGCNVLM